jgi:hypothetical protein
MADTPSMKWTLAQLKEESKKRGLPVSGTKAVLLGRIEEDLKDAEAGKRSAVTAKKGSKKDSKKVAAKASSSSPSTSARPTTKALAKGKYPSYYVPSSDAIDARAKRALAQRMFLLDAEQVDTEHTAFTVSGSTGNLYKVACNGSDVVHVSCTCADFRFHRSPVCKHTVFVMRRVLGVPARSPLWHQRKLARADWDSIANLSALESLPKNVRPHKSVLNKIRRSLGLPTDDADEEPHAMRAISDDTACAICFEEMTEAARNSYEFCQTCENGMHRDCFAALKAATSNQRGGLACPYCRSPWITASATLLSAQKGNEGYVNVGKVLGVSSHRDTSTYQGKGAKGKQAAKGKRKRGG